jgi:hypothetical protein
LGQEKEEEEEEGKGRSERKREREREREKKKRKRGEMIKKKVSLDVCPGEDMKLVSAKFSALIADWG